MLFPVYSIFLCQNNCPVPIKYSCRSSQFCTDVGYIYSLLQDSKCLRQRCAKVFPVAFLLDCTICSWGAHQPVSKDKVLSLLSAYAERNQAPSQKRLCKHSESMPHSSSLRICQMPKCCVQARCLNMSNEWLNKMPPWQSICMQDGQTWRGSHSSRT